jgi:redox-sensitive bicupin YhaK (pirin superfamily)
MNIDIINPHQRDLGTFMVQRLLPSVTHRSIGPFVFMDHMGPALAASGQGMDVRPHPHIGLATVTYLFDGQGLHRDSLGNVVVIRPGDVNWMVAGRGIVHSERTPPEEMMRPHALHGIQTWVALPIPLEQCEPSFVHIGAADLPQLELPGVSVRVIAGTVFGATAPTPVHSPTLYAHLQMQAGSCVSLLPEHSERAIYAVDSALTVGDTLVAPGHLAVLPHGETVPLRANATCTVMLLGGEPLDGARHINWNFVASSRALIEAARQGWQGYPNAQFPAVPDETEFIPLPLP